MKIKKYYSDYPDGHLNKLTDVELKWLGRGLKSDVRNGQPVPDRLMEQIEQETKRRIAEAL